MFIITVGVSVALWLRIRAVNQQNAELRAQFDDLETTQEEATAAPEAWLQAQLAALAADDPTAAVRRVVLEQTLNPADDFPERLSQAVAAAGLVPEHDADGTDLQAQIAALETELAASREGQSTEHAEELKALLQQFTRDSREMMACIQTLESENAELRELLGDKAPPIASPPAEAEPSSSPAAETEPADSVSEPDAAELLTAETASGSEDEAPEAETAA